MVTPFEVGRDYTRGKLDLQELLEPLNKVNRGMVMEGGEVF